MVAPLATACVHSNIAIAQAPGRTRIRRFIAWPLSVGIEWGGVGGFHTTKVTSVLRGSSICRHRAATAEARLVPASGAVREHEAHRKTTDPLGRTYAAKNVSTA